MMMVDDGRGGGGHEMMTSSLLFLNSISHNKIKKISEAVFEGISIHGMFL